MLRKIGNRNTILLSIVFSLSFIFILNTKIKADVITPASAQLSSTKSGSAAAHTIFFVLPSGITAGEQISIIYPSSSFVFGSSYDFNDMSLASGSSSNCETASFTTKTIASTASGTTWGATRSTNTITFVSGTDTLTAGNCVRVILNTNGLNHTLTNPSVTSNTAYNIDINSTDDSGDYAIIILGHASDPDPDEITINSQVFPSIMLGIDTVTTSCNNSTTTTPANQFIDFGTILPGTVYSSGSTYPFVCVSAATNSSTGMRVLVHSSRNHTQGGLVSGGNVVASSTANLNSAASGYGLRVSSTGTPALGSFTATSPFNSGTAGSVGGLNGLLGSPSEIFSSAGPARTGTNSRVAIEVSVKSDTSIGQGTYTDTIIFTAYTKL